MSSRPPAAETLTAIPPSRYPYLRLFRNMAGLKPVLSSREKRLAWLKHLRRLHQVLLAMEIDTLPLPRSQVLARRWHLPMNRSRLKQAAERIAQQLFEQDISHANNLKEITAALRFPEDISFAQRVLGGYPIFAFFAEQGAQKIAEEFYKRHQQPVEQQPAHGRLILYDLERRPANPVSLLQTIFERARTDELGIPDFSIEERDQILRSLVPRIVQDTLTKSDRMGELGWTNDRIHFNANKPTLYTYFSLALRDQTPLLQVNYVFWYPERNGPHAPWLERDRWDGLTFRVTLSPQGEVLWAETVNNCGCYAMAFPHKERVGFNENMRSSVHPFIPRALPNDYPERPVTSRLLDGWHQVAGLTTSSLPGDETRTLQLQPYAILEHFSVSNGFVNLFSPAGILKGSTRMEPLLFFPSGIPRVGLMRQRGRQPVQFTGRAYFADPYRSPPIPLTLDVVTVDVASP